MARKKRPNTFRRNTLRFTGLLAAFQFRRINYKSLFKHTKAITWVPTVVSTQVLDYSPRELELSWLTANR